MLAKKILSESEFSDCLCDYLSIADALGIELVAKLPMVFLFVGSEIVVCWNANTGFYVTKRGTSSCERNFKRILSLANWYVPEGIRTSCGVDICEPSFSRVRPDFSLMNELS